MSYVHGASTSHDSAHPAGTAFRHDLDRELEPLAGHFPQQPGKSAILFPLLAGKPPLPGAAVPPVRLTPHAAAQRACGTCLSCLIASAFPITHEHIPA